jgi:hypothetical protein
MSLVALARLYPNSKVVILDPDDGTEKTAMEMYGELPANLMVIPVNDDWKSLMDVYKQVKQTLTAKDWLCLDMLGRFWDLAQQYYSTYVFGCDPIEHLIMLRKEADKGKEMKAVQFSGFDGLTDWTIIKRLHNEQLMDDAVIRSPFNIMCTTSTGSFLPVEKMPKVGTTGIYASEFGIKVEGEKHNVYRFDTQAVLYRKKEGTYHFRLVRDRGRAINIATEYDITNKTFMDVYAQIRGMHLPEEVVETNNEQGD